MSTTSPFDPESAARAICTARDLTFDRNLGAGAVGDVFLVRGQGARYALKVLRNTEAAGLESFEREMKALVDHPSPFTVRIYAFGTTPVPWYLMDHHEMSLAEWITGHPDRDTDRDTAELFVNDALCGLAEWHGRTPRVVHGDINPGNILVDPARGSAVLADPSLAALRGPRGTDLTGGGLLGGTPGYADPAGNIRTAVADVYSMGATLYAVKARRLEMPQNLPNVVHNDERLSARERAIILTALDPDLSTRYKDAGEMFEAFEEGPIGDLGPMAPTRSLSSSTALYAAGFIALVGVIGFGVWAGRRADGRGQNMAMASATPAVAATPHFERTILAAKPPSAPTPRLATPRLATASPTPVLTVTPIPPTAPRHSAAGSTTAGLPPSPVSTAKPFPSAPTGWELIDQARIALDHGDRNRAQGLYRQAAAHPESRADANRALGLLYFKIGAFAGAADHLERYLVLRPEAPDREEIKRLISRSRS